MRRISREECRKLYDQGFDVLHDLVTGLFDELETLHTEIASLKDQIIHNTDNLSEPLLDEDIEIPLSFQSQEQKQKSHILVVDDDSVVLGLMANILSRRGYTVSTAIHGREALDLLSVEPSIELVLLDILMPEMNGYQVCQEIRKTFEASELPVLLLTALSQVEDLVIGLQVGANDYLTKPVQTEELLARIETHLQLKASFEQLKENKRLQQVIVQKEHAKQEALAEKRKLLRILDKAGINPSLHGEEDEALLREIRRMPESLDAVHGANEKETVNQEFQQALVHVISLALRYWSQTTHKSKVELAEESQIWNVYLDAKGTFRTRTLDRYLKVSTVPRKPRWRDVMQTAYFVLQSCPDTAPEIKKELEVKIKEMEILLH